MHVGFILDGNRRWAKKQNILKQLGHKMGGENFEKILDACPKYGIDTMTVYALSTENFKNREPTEINYLMELLLNFIPQKKQKLLDNDIKVRAMGRVQDLPENVKNSILDLEKATEHCQSFTVQFCVNYGGRDEIIRAVKKVQDQGLELTEAAVEANLDSNLQPELIVRTGGNQRLSNFLVWQSAYSELYFTDVLWPDFSEVDLQAALDFYASQQRNFGK